MPVGPEQNAAGSPGSDNCAPSEKQPADLVIDEASRLIGAEKIGEASQLLHTFAARHAPGGRVDQVFASLCMQFDLPLAPGFWADRARRVLCMNPDSIVACLMAVQIFEVCSARKAEGVRPTEYQAALRRLFVLWCVYENYKPGGDGLSTVVALKSIATRRRDSRVGLDAPIMLADALGQALCRDWFKAPVARRLGRDQVLIGFGDRAVRFRMSNASTRFHFRYFFAFEPGLLKLLSELEAGETFLDIGANIGKYSVLATVFGLRVDAIEPFGRNVDALRENLALNAQQDLVKVHQVALSDRSGEGWVAYDDEQAGSTGHSISDDVSIDPRPGAKHKEPIAVWRVDEMVANGTLAFPNHIKIDVDGVEHKVLDGMSGILSDPRLKSIRLEIRLKDPRKKAALKRVLEHGFVARVGDDDKNLQLTRT